jgi:prevent-host-death family protein
MNQFEDIIPISLFKKDTKEYLSKAEITGAPILLTLHGRGAFVLLHINSFMRNNELAEMGRHSLGLNGMLERMQREPS